jgi:hypothetical protein
LLAELGDEAEAGVVLRECLFFVPVVIMQLSASAGEKKARGGETTALKADEPVLGDDAVTERVQHLLPPVRHGNLGAR